MTDPKYRLLTDEELFTQEDPVAPREKPSWIQWIKENHIPIRSLFSENFSDLQFLRPLLENKRIVQLGESGHGVAQFNQAKVRLIKFLHQECGFGVIAFESSIFECFYANEHVDSMTPVEVMFHSIFGVWYTWEVESLFQYVKESRNTDSPLTLAGFDIQTSSWMGHVKRPDFFKSVISKIDPEYAEAVFQMDSLFISQQLNDDFYTYLANNEIELIQQYENIVQFMDQHMDELLQTFPDNPGIPRIARQTALSMTVYITQKISYWEDRGIAMKLRDKGMADNIDFLLNEVYPESKIVVWAHNLHIRHNNALVDYVYPKVNTMGYWLAQRHGPELYTIGLYMYRGQAGANTGITYYIEQASSGSLESILYRARKLYCYVDILNETPNNGNSWMFEPILAKAWGTTPLKMVLKKQYDGILFIDTVNPPDYIPADYFQSKTFRKGESESVETISYK